METPLDLCLVDPKVLTLSADDYPVVLPGGVGGDLRRGEKLLRLTRHGRPPTGALGSCCTLLASLTLVLTVGWGRREISSR